MKGRRLVTWVVVLVAAVASGAAPSMVELARNGRWQRVLKVAAVRNSQLPLTSDEALIAAEAARIAGSKADRALYLAWAVGDTGPGQVAALELASLLLDVKPSRALKLAVGVLKDPETWRLRVAAARLAGEALERGARPGNHRGWERLVRRQPRSLRRQLRLGMALSSTNPVPGLVRLLKERPNDAPAFRAARELQTRKAADPMDRAWLVGQALYWHGLYAEAAQLLQRVERAGAGSPRWKVAFLLGRCSFRRELWPEAERWYRLALRRAPNRSTRAELEVHLARVLELTGRVPGALAWARKAVRNRRTDDRLLLQARLALAVGRQREAKTAISRCRRRSARDRGLVLRALDELRWKKPEEAGRLLTSVRRGHWRGPALVAAAALEGEGGRPDAAMDLLQRAAESSGGAFWELAARDIVESLPPESVVRWRKKEGPGAKTGLEHLVLWATLEPDRTLVEGLRREMVVSLGSGEPAVHGLAAELWGLGLEQMAARWDPRGFGRATAAEAAASAVKLSELGEVDEGMVAADAARRRLHARAPVSMLPRELARALYPLPLPRACRAEAGAAGVPWWLLAAVVREESRWDEEALSVVGARGLVQLMPETASSLAASLGEPAPGLESLFDPAVALHLGSRELARLAKEFSGRPALIATAYNAGEFQARQWMKECPDPCSDPVLILTVGFGATRSYAADVTAAARWYRELYGVSEDAAAAVQVR